MYSACLFCARRLGSNDVLELFPVGKRLAFDPAKGRLWVICERCQRWNLTPLEERWESVEQCERLFRSTTIRVATDNIGLARLPAGLDLVRIGAPLRPEFASWRYGSELLRRRWKDLRSAAGVVGGVAGVTALTAGTAFITVLALPVIPMIGVGGVVWQQRAAARRPVARVTDARGNEHLIRHGHLRSIRFTQPAPDALGIVTDSDQGTVELVGDAAARIAGVVCADRNRVGGSRKQVADAIQLLERSGGSAGVRGYIGTRGPFNGLWYAERLALEMALQEDMERRALDGELRQLEAAWKEAEEIAAIADNLLLG